MFRYITKCLLHIVLFEIQLLYVGYYIIEKLDLLAVWQFIKTKALLQTGQDKLGELEFCQVR